MNKPLEIVCGYTVEQRLKLIDEILTYKGNPAVDLMRFVAEMQITLRDYYIIEFESPAIPDDHHQALTDLFIMACYFADVKPEYSPDLIGTLK